MPNRIDQLNSQLQADISQIIMQEIELPADSLITVTKVNASKDIKYARVFISIIPDTLRGTILKILTKTTPHLQKVLSDRMLTKFTPKLRFIIDENETYASEIDKLLDSIKKE